MHRLLLAVMLLSPARLLPAADEDGFVPLFDGQTLTGWHGNPTYWAVLDGAIVGRTEGNIPANTFLISDGTYGDFVLKVKFRLHDHRGNSGIQFRSEELPPKEGQPPFIVAGYQADIADNHFLGILYGERTGRGIIQDLTPEQRAAVAAAYKPKDWNEYVITAKGDHVTLTLNGVTTVDLDDPPGAKSGVIALQLHRGHDMTISFKDLLIKRLD
jgi:hypothetical protein